MPTYKGNCHCGANRYEVELPDTTSAVSCNCSLCTKKGCLWSYPCRQSFRYTRGGQPSTLTVYRAGNIGHEFCSLCGVGLVGHHGSTKPDDSLTLNVRTIWDLNPFKLTIEKLDGRRDEIPVYTPVAFTGPLPPAEGDDLKLYTGSCHCGAVTLAFKTKPLPEVELKQDNCSICTRIGAVGVYPHQSQVTIIGKEHTVDYLHGRKWGGNPFCKTCGIHPYGNLYGPPKEIVGRLSDEKKAYVKKTLEMQPLNVRVFDDVEWEQIMILKEDEGTEGYVLPD